MDVTVRYCGGVKFEAEARGHRVISDQPASNSGADEGMTPPELFLAGLATCAGFYAAAYLKNHRLSADDLEIRVAAEKVPQPWRLGSIRIEVNAPSAREEHLAGLQRAVDACLIHKTLATPPHIETVIHTAALV